MKHINIVIIDGVQLQKFGVIRMYEKITNLKKKIQDMKKSRLQTVYNQIFKFKPFSKKQKQVLTWWCATSPVKDYDGIIADGAIRSGKTVCMSLSYVMWAMETFNGQNFAMCGKTIGSFRRNVLFWLKLMLKARDYGVVDHRCGSARCRLLTKAKWRYHTGAPD